MSLHRCRAGTVITEATNREQREEERETVPGDGLGSEEQRAERVRRGGERETVPGEGLGSEEQM